MRTVKRLIPIGVALLLVAALVAGHSISQALGVSVPQGPGVDVGTPESGWITEGEYAGAWDLSKGMPPVPDHATPAKGISTPGNDLWTAAEATFGVNRMGGISGRDENLTLYLTAPPNGEAQPAEFMGYPVVTVAKSYKELDEAKLALDLAYADLESGGVTLIQAGVDIPKNALSIMVLSEDDDISAEVERVTELLAGTPIVFSHGSELNESLTGPRHNDEPPYHWGGAKIGTLGGDCTSGFPWINQYGMLMMLSAGHCNYWYPNSGIFDGTPPGAYGTSIWNGLYDPTPWRRDVLAMVPNASSGTYMGWFYIGSTTSLLGYPIGAWYPGPQWGVSGLQLSGAKTGAHPPINGGVVEQVNVSVNLDEGIGWTNNVNTTWCHTEKGDSGGTMFVVGGDGVKIVAGVISAKSKVVPDLCFYVPTNMIAANHGGAPLGWP